MIQYKRITKAALILIAVGSVAGCTKLNEKLSSTVTNAQVVGSFGTAAPSCCWQAPILTLRS